MTNGINFKQFFIEVSEYELSQMGKQKGKYNYVSADDYEKLRPYLVQKSQQRASKNKIALDPTMTAYTPGETLDLISHPEVQKWFHKMRNFRIPDEYEKVILVPCAATKPWGLSCKRGDFYPSYNEIRKEVQEKKIKPVYFVTISEPLGVVPEAFWGDEPKNVFPQYDNPGLFQDTPLQSGMTTQAWSKSPLGSKREMPFDKNAYGQAIEILGKEIGAFLSNNSHHEFISFVEHANPKEKSTHSKMLDIAEKVSGILINRNSKKPFIGRKKSPITVAQHIKSKI
jgi:hypothetical protein